MQLVVDFVAIVAYTTNKMIHIVFKSDGRRGVASRHRLAPFPTGHGGGAKWWWWSLVKVVIGRVPWSTVREQEWVLPGRRRHPSLRVRWLHH